MNGRGVGFFFAVLLTVGLFSSCAPGRTKTIRVAIDAKPTGSFKNPVKNGRIVSPFGKRGRGGFHTGLDLQRRKGAYDAVLAARSGKVVYLGTLGAYGKMVVLQHADGYKTRYAHLKSIEVKKGDELQVGDKIGVMGKTGRATGVHLHFEILTPGNQFVNPKPFIF